ncbi:MAG: hypothetical protein ABGX16_09320 [Pirellulales bacterium]
MDESTHVEYRRVSVLAILALLLGITSSCALIGKVLLALPVIGLGVSLLAISKIHASEGHYSGRALAQWGLFFSVLFGVAAVVRPPLFQEVIGRQSKTFAQSWLQLLVQGDSKQALKYVGIKSKGQLAPVDAQGKPNVDGDMAEEVIFQNFCEQPIIQQLQTAGKQASIRYEQTVDKPLPTDRPIGVVQIFSITGNDLESQITTDSPAPFYVQLYLTRNHANKGQPAVWFVNRWEPASL